LGKKKRQEEKQLMEQVQKKIEGKSKEEMKALEYFNYW